MKYFTNNEMKEIAVKFMKERVLYYKWNTMLSLCMKSLKARAKSPTSRSRNACRIGFGHERSL